MNSPSKFSIITVCRNEAATVRDTCKSIVTQSWKDYEWIVIDGASTDGTLNILEEFRDNFTALISEPDQGIYDAMNKGIDLARGEYVVFMNGGDTFASEHVLKLVAQSPQKDLIYGNLRYDTIDGEIKSYPNQFRDRDLIKWMIPHQASFYRREIFDIFGKYDTNYHIAADYELNARMIAKHRISHFHVDEPLAIFDRSGVSSDPLHKSLRKKENHRVRMKYLGKYRWNPKAWRQIARNWLENLAHN